uniref:Uncharacterized protein n=1 Tax=Rhizophora mucronata TaxID=61149 RepID=A0A2P2M3N0_RHIMU
MQRRYKKVTPSYRIFPLSYGAPEHRYMPACVTCISVNADLYLPFMIWNIHKKKGRIPTLQLAGGDIKLLPPDLLTI